MLALLARDQRSDASFAEQPTVLVVVVAAVGEQCFGSSSGPSDTAADGRHPVEQFEQVAAFNSGDWEQMRAGLASDSRYDELGTERRIDGPEKILELFKGWKQAFPDAVGTVTSAVASGDKAALEVIWKGTHTGPLTTAENELRYNPFVV